MIIGGIKMLPLIFKLGTKDPNRDLIRLRGGDSYKRLQ